MAKIHFKMKLGRVLFLSILFSSIKGQVVINEFLASNHISVQDEYGDYDDWIELFNPTEDSLILSGYYLSDDMGNLNKWVFPQDDSQFIIPAGGYIVLWADGEPKQGLNHLSFSLSKDGEEIVITEPDGYTIIDQKTFGYQRTDISMGRDSLNNNIWSYFISPTMGSENGFGYQEISETPAIMPQRGYFNQPLSISMTNSDSSQSIHYTITGNDPTENDPLYNNEITISNTTVLNAKGFKDGFIPSLSKSHFYLMNEPYSLPVLAILTDPVNLWDDSSGIYVHYLNEGVLWERRCTNQYFTVDSLFSIPSGIRIQGRSSRVKPKKSFRLFYKNAYDQDRLIHPMFGPTEPITFKNLVLRSGYDDDIQMPTGTLIRDPLVTELWENLGMLASRGNFTNLYLNDQYWGIYNIRESVNEHFISDHTGYLDFDLIRYLKSNIDLKFGTLDEWSSLNSFMRNVDFSVDDNYEEALNRIDIDNFLNLQALIICSEYRSWGWGVSAYRENTPAGRWKWTIWDMDRAFTNSNWNGFTFLNDTTGLGEPNAFAFRLLRNNQFKVDYINRISDFLNSLFKPENVISKIDSLESLLTADIPFEAERWNRTVSHWENNIETLRSFAENRPPIITQQLIEYFSLAGKGEVVLNSSAGGNIRINSLSIKDFPWNGSYFQDIPISIEAIPDSGYVFEGWSNDGLLKDNPMIVNPSSDTTYFNALFSPMNILDALKIITPAISEIDQFHPLVFRYYDEQDNLLMNNDPLVGDLLVNDSVLDSAVIIKKGIGTYLLNMNDMESPISLKVQIDDYLGNETIIPQFIPSQTDTVTGSIPLGETIWGDYSNILIDGDLDIPSGASLVINAGSQIRLSEHSNIIIFGDLNIAGTKDNPVLFKSDSWNHPWGGIEFYNSNSEIKYCFFINAGSDPDKGWGHTNKQPIIFVKENSNLTLNNSFILYSPGKALGSHTSVVNVDSTIISFVFHGGEFDYTYLTFNHSYILNIPNNDGIFADDDNDGFHINYRHPQIQDPSRIMNSFFITGKDDAIDHHGARINVENCWIEDWMHEGIASSIGDTVIVLNTLVKKCMTGYEAGWGSPILIVDHSVAIENETGFRFGDNYSTPSTGQLRVTNSIAFNNDDNINNYTNHLNGPYPGGIQLSFSITNDSEYDTIPTNLTGVPIFKSNYKLHHYSIGSSMGTAGTNLGLVDTSVLNIGSVIINEIMYKSSSDYDSGDWIELFNPSEDSLNVSSWILKDDDNDHLFQFLDSVIIPEKEYLIISKDLEAFQSVYSLESQILGDIPYGFGLGDQVRLYSSIMILADSLEYGIDDPWPSSPNNLGPSLELINMEDNTIPENWSASLIIGGTPGSPNSLSSLHILNESIVVPMHFELTQNYPNPFNDQTLIQFLLPEKTQTRITVFDILGREIKILNDKVLIPGPYIIKWDGTDNSGRQVSAGVYLYQIQAGEFTQTRKMLLLK
jgi:hypothetical protein